MGPNTYGQQIANWSELQSSAAMATVVSPSQLPPDNDGERLVLKLQMGAVPSFGQQHPLVGGANYLPKGTSPGFTAAVWAMNPGSRTLNFELRLFNASADHWVVWVGACDPGGWRLLTMSPSQQWSSKWAFGVDAVGYVRVSQMDDGPEGPWSAGDVLLFGDVYVDVAAQPVFLLTFDDGNASQRHADPGFDRLTYSPVVSSSADVLTTAAVHHLVVGAPLIFTATAPDGLVSGQTYWVKAVPSASSFQLSTREDLADVAATNGFSGQAAYRYGGSQATSAQQLVEGYGFKGSLFVVPAWLGTSGQYGYVRGGSSFLSRDDVVAMWNEGWSVGSHSNSHPSNQENAGLRLLGPYGYYLSNTYDNLPPRYLQTWGISAANGRRRVVSGSVASPSVFVAESPHRFLLNQPIVFTDIAPTGCELGVTYYVRDTPTPTTFTLATDQGSLLRTVNNTTQAWQGLANYRWPGSAPDDSAIYGDVVAGASGVAALGIPTGFKFFALPQGGQDEYVRSACIRAGLTWVRGVSGPSSAHTIPGGQPTGAGLSGPVSGGWMSQLDAVQTDGANSIEQITRYADDTIKQGACGCCYHHAFLPSNRAALDTLCSHLRKAVDAGTLDVLTLDQYAKKMAF